MTPDAGSIRSHLDGRAPVARWLVADSVDSTNAWIRREAQAGAPDWTVALAGSQTAGRGRLGRDWHSRPGAGLYLSVRLETAQPLDRWTRWTIGAGGAAARAVRDVSDLPAELEWPNDVMLQGRKLGGLLVEGRRIAAGGELIVGAGLNLSQSAEDWPDALREVAISLRQAGRDVSAEALAAEFLARLAEAHRRLQSGAWSEVARDWEALAPRAVGCRVEVRFSEDRPPEIGVTDGIDERGALVVRIDGRSHAVQWVDAVRWLDAEDR